MNLTASSRFLRRTLIADAVISGGTGLLMLIGAPMLDALLGIPAAVLRITGASLLPFAAAVLFLARQEPPSRTPVLTVAALNVAWVAASVLLLVSGWIAPTTLGVAFVLFQAVVVAAFADVQYVVGRRIWVP